MHKNVNDTYLQNSNKPVRGGVQLKTTCWTEMQNFWISSNEKTSSHFVFHSRTQNNSCPIQRESGDLMSRKNNICLWNNSRQRKVNKDALDLKTIWFFSAGEMCCFPRMRSFQNIITLTHKLKLIGLV